MRLPLVKIFYFEADQYLRDWAVQAAELLVGFGYTVQVIPAAFNGCKTFPPDNNSLFVEQDERTCKTAITLAMVLYQLYMERLHLSGPSVDVHFVEIITDSNL